jgi:hypothetical protein
VARRDADARERLLLAACPSDANRLPKRFRVKSYGLYEAPRTGASYPCVSHEGAINMTGYDYDRPFMDHASMKCYDAIDSATAAQYGKTVLAVELSNSEYGQRFQNLARANNMKAPPSAGRIFSGWPIVRNTGTRSQYETWMPEMAFDDCDREQAQ